MENTRYRVILTGEILDNFTTPQVVNSAAKLFKCGTGQAQKFFRGKPTPLKKIMDQATADRYQQRLAQAGIACRIEAVAGAASNKASFSASAPKTTPKPKPAKPPAPAATHELSPMDSRKKEAIRKLIDDDSNLSLVDDAPKTPKGASTSPSGEFQCPKCKTAQPQGNECISCGIIFDKFHESEPQTQSAQAQPVAQVPQTAVEDDEDIEDEWEDITLFVGDNLERYHDKFHAMFEKDDGYVAQWHWPAFFIPLPWLIYRKMYLVAVVYTALMAATPIFPLLVIPMMIATGMLGNFIYYRFAIKQIGNIMTAGDERREDVAHAGSTNSMILTIGITIATGFLLSAFNYVVYFKPMMEETIRLAASNIEDIRTSNATTDQRTRVKMLLLKNAIVMQKKVSVASDAQFTMPSNMDELQQVLSLPPNATNDSWNKRMKFSTEDKKLMFHSAGPDGEFDTFDDITYDDTDE